MTFSLGFLLGFCIIYVVGTFIGLYGIFKKAGRTPWHALIPFYNLYAWLRVIQRPLWWLIFLAIPYLNVFTVMLMIWKTARMCDQTRYITLIPITMFAFIGVPYLGFSKNITFYTLDTIPEKELGFWHSNPINKKKPIKGEKDGRTVKTKTRSWCDAIIYAVVAAYIIRTFMFEFYKIPTSSMESTLMIGDYLAVSKSAYGPKLPQTPLAIPFVHHTMPLTKYTKSYIEKIQFPYYRFPGRNHVQRYDAVVFNYPDGDTVALERQSESYYAILRNLKRAFQHTRDYANQYYFCNGDWVPYSSLFQKYGFRYQEGMEYDVIRQEYQIRYRPVDKRENYIKRCVGIPGDTLSIKQAVLYVNGKKAYQAEKAQLMYIVVHNGMDISESNRKKLNINEEDRYAISPNATVYHLHPSQVEKIKTFPNVVSIEPQIAGDSVVEPDIFPFDERYGWNKDNFGPIVIPQAGATVELNDSTICLYARIIKNYEGNDLKIENGKIYINGVESHCYTFKMNYYWMMGDNRHNSADSRYWGFVPENHIVGKANFAWLSVDKFKDWGEGKIRWKRMFKKIK